MPPGRRRSSHPGANALMMLGNAARMQDRLAEAHPLLQESHRIFAGLGEQGLLAWSLAALGDVLVDQGDLRTAEAHYRQALAVFRRQGDGDQTATAACLWRFARLAKLTADRGRAVQLFAAVHAIRCSVGVAPEPTERPCQEQQLEELKGEMGAAAFAAAWKAGETLSWEQAAAWVLDELEPLTHRPAPAEPNSVL